MFFVTGLLVASLALTACTAVDSSPSAAPLEHSTAPTPSATPFAPERLIVGVDGVTFDNAGRQKEARFSDSEKLLALVTEVAGISPAVSKVDDAPGYSFHLTAYDWIGLKIVSNGTDASISVTGPRLGAVSIETAEGVAVGSTRASLLALHPTEIADEDGDGVADDLALNSREEPGTNSLSHPGTTGSIYLLVTMNGDSVKQIQSPSNDFSDI